MSKSEDGFQVVKPKRSKKRTPSEVPNIKQILNYRESKLINKENSKRRILEAKEELLKSDYWESFLVKTNQSLVALKPPKVTEILCFGLGHIGECLISQYQLALLLCVKDHFNTRVFAHDPVFCKSECELLKELEIQCIVENREGRHKICSDSVTLVYLPHCPKQLTDNFLAENWGPQLRNLILICNSFKNLIDSQPSRLLNSTVPHITSIFPYAQELILNNSFKYNDIFNDTSVHIFPELSESAESFWNKKLISSSTDNVEFITAQMIKKLDIS